MRWVRIVLASAVLVGACTQPPDDDGSVSPSVSDIPSSSPSVVEPTGARLADGTPLPEGCTSAVVKSQTVAFVAEDRAWALDPETNELSCLFEVEDAGPFAWGPQGDRVLLGGFAIRGVGDAPDLPAIKTRFTAFDWGHPLGLAVAFADGRGQPRKRFIDDGRQIRLDALPEGRYLHVAYHPSGLALAFVVETDEGQEIWLSTNEGEDPQRLIFSKRGTTFTALAFSPNGERLWWTAEHEEGYPELHFMNLDTRTGFGTAWRGDEGTVAGGLKLPPKGPLFAVTRGGTCEEHEALVLSGGSTTVALPDESRPTEALGWLDRKTLLVAAGGCGDTIDLYAVDGRGQDDPAALVLEVEMGAPRTQVVDPPDSVPAPQPDEEPPPDGVG